MTDHRIDADRIGEEAKNFRSQLNYPYLQAVQGFEVFVYSHAQQIISNPKGDESREELNWTHPARAKNTVDTIRESLLEVEYYKAIPLHGLVYLAADQLVAHQKKHIRDERKREYPRVLLQDIAFDLVGVIFPNNGLQKEMPNW